MASRTRKQRSTEMTTGALIFAFNNTDIDYVEMAAWTAQRVKQHLNIPVAVVTDSDQASQYTQFDKVITAPVEWDNTHRFFEDLGKSVPWKNANRVDAFHLTPWDRTLVLDADYVVNSNVLKPYLNCQQDFVCYRWAADATSDQASPWDLNYFGTHRFPMWWATVMIFNKVPQVKMIFESMTMIRNNWHHYRALYGIQSSQYRNDYALSIALGIETGHTLLVNEIQGSMLSIAPNVALTQQQDEFLIQWQDSEKRLKYLKLNCTDFHAMGKGHLGEIIASDRRAGLFNPGY